MNIEFQEKLENNSFVLPEYDQRSVLNIPSTIIALFGGIAPKPVLPKDYWQKAVGAKKNIFLLIDGLGNNLFQREGIKYPFFKSLATRGFYSPITAVFPPTTSASMNTINSGLSPLEHGLPEWYIYFQELGCVVQSLPFKPVLPEDEGRIVNPPADILFSQKTIYQTLSEAKIPSYALLHSSYANSFYNQAAFAGCNIVPYSSQADLVVSLRKVTTEVSGPAYIFAYYSDLDGAEHEFGPDSEQVKTQLSLMSYLLQEEFIKKLSASALADTALILSADHGQVSTDPSQTTYLDEIDGFLENCVVNAEGKIIPPSGAARGVYLHVKEDRIDDTIRALTEKLSGKAFVIKTKEAINAGLFGEGITHPQFINRVGNVLVLAKGNNTVWYHFAPGKNYDYRGYHGGLSEEEMKVPFICTKLSDLK